MRLGVRVIGALCVLAGWGAQAAAQEGGQQAFAEAEATFQRGENLFAQGDAQGAEVEFRRAYDLMRGHPNQPLILANIARCVERQGRDGEALALYEQMIHETSALAERNEGARRARQDAQERAAALRARGVTSGGSISPIGPIVMGAGAAVAIAGAIAGGVALAQRDSVLSRCVDSRCPPETEEDAAEIDSIALAADILLFGGLAIAVTGLVLTFVLPSESGMQAAASCGPTGCYAALGGSFR
jgi:tetratricopeptide (TPR) repeat protein